MKTFILLTKLSSEISMHMKERQALGRNWLNEVKKKCPEVKFKAHYALLGLYDFIDIYEAPDDETAALVSIISRENGAFEAQSLPAIPYKDFIKITKKL